MLKMTTALVVAAGLLAVGCSKKKEEGTAQKPTEGSAATPPPQPEAPKPLTGTALADKYKACMEMINGAKFEDFKKECVADSFVAHDYGSGTDHKVAEMADWFQSMKTAMPDWKMSPQLVVVNGRNILAVVLSTGTHTGPMKTPMGEVPATNKKVGMMMFHRLAIDEANKATEEWAYADPMTMMSQLGLAPAGSPPMRPAMETGIEGAPIIVVTADDDKEKANLALADKGIEALNAGKFADAVAMLAPDAVVADQTEAADVKGTKDIEAGTKMWFTAFKDAKLNVTNKWAGGDYVIMTGTFSGTHDKDIGKMLKKTGKPVNLDYAEIMMVKDGKGAQIWRFTSAMQFMMQLGLMPAPGAPPADGAKPAEEKK